MYILVYCENTDAGDPIDSVHVRFFKKKENAQKAMEDAYKATDAIMHYSDMTEDDENYVAQSGDSITVHAGMDSLRWEIMEAKPEDADNDAPAAIASDATMLVLYHIGHDSWNRPVYASNGTLYVDTDPRKGRKPKIFTKNQNGFDSEPDCPVSDKVNIQFIPERETWD